MVLLQESLTYFPIMHNLFYIVSIRMNNSKFATTQLPRARTFYKLRRRGADDISYFAQKPHQHLNNTILVNCVAITTLSYSQRYLDVHDSSGARGVAGQLPPVFVIVGQRTKMINKIFIHTHTHIVRVLNSNWRRFTSGLNLTGKHSGGILKPSLNGFVRILLLICYNRYCC